MARLTRITLRRLDLPLVRPYRLAYRTFETFEPFLVEVEDDAGGYAFGDGHISPGSSSETREGGWAFLSARIAEAVGKSPESAKAGVLEHFAESKVATTALVTAIEALEGNAMLTIDADATLPLLTPINAMDADGIAAEIEDWLGQGFKTFKVKVGKDVEADLARVATIQQAAGGRATLRLDANRAFDRDQAIRFASGIDPKGIELFEQPCDADDWDANAAVAARSNVPLMLDEPICTLADIERAATIEGVAFCKLKLKRFGGLERLREGMEAVRTHGMEPVLGDGLGSEVQSWLEACVARSTTRLAGEFNGFLKPTRGLFRNPLPFRDGSIELEAGYVPQLDTDAVEAATTDRRVFQ